MVFTLILVVGSYLWAPSRDLMTESAVELMKVTWPSWAETASRRWPDRRLADHRGVPLRHRLLRYKLMVDWLPTLWGKL